MGTSPLVNTERADAEPAGRDARALGPSDTTDSGSDLVGTESMDINDPFAPVDVATGADVERSPVDGEGLDESGDAAGTGERRAAAADAGQRDGANIGPDRVIDLDSADVDETAGEGLDALDLAAVDDTPEDDEDASDAERDSRPLPNVGQTESQPDRQAAEPRGEQPATGVATHGSATSRKI